MRSRISLVLGLILAIGAFAALFVLGQVVNPSPYRVVVVVREVSPGSRLTSDLVATDPQSISPKVAKEYILEEELEEYLGATIVNPLHPGQPLMHAHLVRAGNPAAERRLSLVLEDAAMAAMVIPVDAKKAPQDLRAGDRVDFLYGVGRVQTQNASIPTPPSPFDDSVAAGVTTSTVAGPEGAIATATPMPEFEFPMAKAVVRDLEVLGTVHDEQPNPAYGGPDSGQPPTIKGELKAVQVAVPREKTEILHYAITTGDYQLALLSPNAPNGRDDRATLGMTWEDLEAFFWKEREMALEAITDTATLDGPGAAALVSTPQGTPVVLATPGISSTTSVTSSLGSGLETPSVDLGSESAPETPSPSPEAGNAEEQVPGEEAANSDSSAAPPAGESGPSAGLGLGLNEGIVSKGLGKGLACAVGGLFLVGLIAFSAVRVMRSRSGS
jgi:Flp pilus assembly protein CpaB